MRLFIVFYFNLGQKVKDIQGYLLDRCKQGDTVAQREIYKLYAKNMYNTAFRILGHSGEAEDVLQDAFLEVFIKMNEYREDSSFGTWLKKIVINKSISQLRKRKIDLIDTHNFENDIADDTSDLDFQLEENNQTIELIKKGINALPEGYKVVISLYLLEGYDHIEIAEILNVSESTSKTQYLRAKNKLKDWLIKSNINVQYE